MSSGRRHSPHVAGNQNHSPASIEPFYTNEDVALLHDIVVLAHELLPSLPERERLPTNALFSAYDDLLPRIGVNADHDSRYARILFKIGGLRGEGTLYEKFEEILSRMGIEIEFDEVAETEYEDEEHGSAPAILEDTAAYEALQDENVLPRGRRRRNSDSAWDLAIDTPARSRSRRRRNSLSSLHKARVQPITDRRGLVREVLQQQPSNQLHRDDARGSNVGAWLNATSAPQRKTRERSISTQRGMRIRRRSLSVADERPVPTTATSDVNSDDYPAESEITAVSSNHEVEEQERIIRPPRPHSTKPSAGLMQAQAEVMQQLRLSYLARHQLRNWRSKALELRKKHAQEELIATTQDKTALLYQALDMWRARYLEKRAIVETRRFFAIQERRADYFYNVYLLFKTFSNWHETTLEEAERTRAARRHILRNKIFNAWREITVVNEFKVRRHVVKKFFGFWQARQTRNRNHDAEALQRYEHDLVAKVFKHWLQKMLASRAENRWVEKLKQKIMVHWRASVRINAEQNDFAVDVRNLQISRKTLTTWRLRTQHLLDMDESVSRRCQNHTQVTILRKWRKETNVIPQRRVLQTEVAKRVLRSTFQTWLQRSRLESQARAVDRMHMLREALTTWRHKVRSRKMQSFVNERIAGQAFCRWKLEERVTFFRNYLNEKRRSTVLQHWAGQALEVKKVRLYHEALARQTAAQKKQRVIIAHWAARCQSQLQLYEDAATVYNTRLSQSLLPKWTERLPHLRQLQQWSEDANFYFLASKSLRRWKAATETSKREKRKAAYAQVRRTTKMNACRAILQVWRSKAQNVSILQTQVEQIRHNKAVIVGMEIFDRWRARAEELGEMEAVCRERALRKTFGMWRERAMAFQDLNAEAVIGFHERQQSRATKRWKLITLQIRGRDIQAAEIQEKNAKRTFRRMLRYWQQKAADRRPVRRSEEAEGRMTSRLGATARAEAWSDFGDEEEFANDDVAASTPLPGYLSTPSRRTERVLSMAARFTSTTPRVPLSTPFERQLRAQYSGGPLPSQRLAPGRSTLGMSGGGFQDIDDGSAKNNGQLA